MTWIKAVLGLVCGRVRSYFGIAEPPQQSRLYTSLCTGELNAIRKQNAFSAVLSTEGYFVGPCWEHWKPKGPEGSSLINSVGCPDQESVSVITQRTGSSRCFTSIRKEEAGRSCGSFLRKGEVCAHVGLSFRSFRFFVLPTQADTGNCSVKRPCFLSDLISPPCTEYRKT